MKQSQPADPLTVSVSDFRALKGLCQRNGGALSPGRAERLLLLGLARLREDVAECYPERAASYSPTVAGWAVLKAKGVSP